MKNDEKIDIVLAEDVPVEEMTQEELIELNYETAMRYINIAEYMKQYEEQDKYYHRAIKTLKVYNDDHRYDGLIRELNLKKFGIRAEGKINLYEEACSIRDKARTPQDYYSAQALFRRIALYEPKHPIRERWVSPEVYQKAMQCTDSALQAERCEELAIAQEKKDKRHSLYASIALVAAILALVIFSRTITSRRVLANLYELTGNYNAAFQKYYYVFEHGNDKDAYLKYLENRYKSGQKFLEACKAAKEGPGSENFESAYKDFAALCNPREEFGFTEGYKDARKQFCLLEKENIKNGVLSEVVHFARMDWRVLEKKDGRVLLGKDHALGSTPFDQTGEHATWADCSARQWLNNEYLNEAFYKEEIELILDTEVPASANKAYPGVDPGKDTTDKLFLMSIDEVEKYYHLLHETETWWWLRTPGAAEGTMAFVNREKQVMPYGYEITSPDITIKPAIWVSID